MDKIEGAPARNLKNINLVIPATNDCRVTGLFGFEQILTGFRRSVPKGGVVTLNRSIRLRAAVLSLMEKCRPY